MNLNLSSTCACFLFVSASACSSSSNGASVGDGGSDDGRASNGESDDAGGSASGGGGDDGGASAADGANSLDGAGSVQSGIQTTAVNLGSAGSYVILAKTGISSVPTSAVTGDLGVSPAAASYITGFGLKADATNVFSTSSQVTGKVYASDYAVPTPANLTTAVADMQLAFADAAGRAPGVTALGAGNIGGKTLAPGVYKWATGLLIPTDVTLDGTATGVWIFQIAQNLTVSNGAKIVLSGGALAKNVFWQVSGSVDLGTTVQFEGVLLGQTSITLETGGSITGRLLAQTAVTIAGSAVVEPAP